MVFHRSRSPKQSSSPSIPRQQESSQSGITKHSPASFFTKLSYDLLTFRQRNHYSLFHLCARPFEIACATLCLEYIVYISVILNEYTIDALASADESMRYLEYISLFSISTTNSQSILIACFLLNLLLVLTPVAMFTFYAVRENFVNASLPIFSFITKSYLPIFMVPQLFLAFKHTQTIGIVNIPLVLLLGYWSAISQTNFDFRNTDELAKLESSSDIRKYVLDILFVIGSSQLDNIYPSILCLLIISNKLINWLVQDSHLNRRIGLLDFQLAIALGIWNCTLSLSIGAFGQETSRFFLIWVLVSLVLSIRIGQVMFERRIRHEENVFLRCTEECNTNTKSTLSSNNSISNNIARKVNAIQLDFYVRTIWANFNSSTQSHGVIHNQQVDFLVTQHDQNCVLPQCFCAHHKSRSASIVAEQVAQEQRIAKSYVIDFIESVMKQFVSSSNNNIANGTNTLRLTSVHFSYLFFLLDCSKNEPMLGIELLTTYNRFFGRVSSFKLSVLHYLISIQEQRKPKQSSIFSVIRFDDELDDLAERLMNALKLKEGFLETIASPLISLQSLDLKGKQLIIKRQQIDVCVKNLLRINPQSQRLQFLMSNFFYNIAFDQARRENVETQLLRSTVNNKSFIKNSAVLFASLSPEDFASVKYVSSMFRSLFAFEKVDILNKNCSIVMPKYIADVHNTVIKKYVERGMFAKRHHSMQPFFIVNKYGYLMQVYVDLQFSMIDLSRVGVCALLRTEELQEKESIIVADVNQRYNISGCTRRIFEDLFSFSLDTPCDCTALSLQQIIPILPLIIDSNPHIRSPNMDRESNTPGGAGFGGGAELVKDQSTMIGVAKTIANSTALIDDDSNFGVGIGGTGIGGVLGGGTGNNKRGINKEVDSNNHDDSKIFALEPISTIAFLPKNSRQFSIAKSYRTPRGNINRSFKTGGGSSKTNNNSNYNSYDCSVYYDEILEDMKQGSFDLQSTHMFLVVVRAQIIVDDYICMCQAIVESIEYVHEPELKLECMRALFFPQVRKVSSTLDEFSDEQLLLAMKFNPIGNNNFSSVGIQQTISTNNRLRQSIAYHSQQQQLGGAAQAVITPPQISNIQGGPDYYTQSNRKLIAAQLEGGNELNDSNENIVATPLFYDPQKNQSQSLQQLQLHQELQELRFISPKFTDQPFITSPLNAQQINNTTPSQANNTSLINIGSINNLSYNNNQNGIHRQKQQRRNSKILYNSTSIDANTPKSKSQQPQNSHNNSNSNTRRGNQNGSFGENQYGQDAVQEYEDSQQNLESFSGQSINYFSNKNGNQNNFINSYNNNSASQYNESSNILLKVRNRNASSSFSHRNIRNPSDVGGASGFNRERESTQIEASSEERILLALGVSGFKSSTIIEARNSSEKLVFSQQDISQQLQQSQSLQQQRFTFKRQLQQSKRPSTKENLRNSMQKTNSNRAVTDAAGEVKSKSKSKSNSSQQEEGIQGEKNEAEYAQQLEQLFNSHAESISSFRSSVFVQQKKMIFNSLSQSSRRFKFFKWLIFASAITLISVGFIIYFAFAELEKEFSIQTRNFYYISWGMNHRIPQSRIIKNMFFRPLLGDSRMVNLTSSEVQSVEDAFREDNLNQHQLFMHGLRELTKEPIKELYLVQNITNTKYELRVYLEDTRFVSIKTSAFNSLMNNALVLLQSSLLTGVVDSKIERRFQQSLFNNFMLLVVNFNQLQAGQEQDITSVYESIKVIVGYLLIGVCSVSALFVIIVFPIFSISQQKKQEVLALFATIAPQRIRDMHRVLLISIRSLEADRDKNDPMTKSGRFFRVGTSNVKTIAVTEHDLMVKKKKISSTSILPKHNGWLFFKGLVLYIFLVIYPIANYITTISLISQANNNQTIAGLLQTMKAQISSNFATFSIMVNVHFNTTGSLPFHDPFYKRYASVQKNDPLVLSKFTNQIQVEKQQSRFYNDEYNNVFFRVISGDACAAIEEYPDYFSPDLFNVTACRTKFNGLLQSGGLQSAFNWYSRTLADPAEIFALTDQDMLMKLLQVYLANNNVLEINELYGWFVNLIDCLSKFLVQKNDEFFSFMEVAQTALIAFEFLMLILIFKYGLVQFLVFTMKDLMTTRQILTLLQIPYLIENPYIMNFIAS